MKTIQKIAIALVVVSATTVACKVSKNQIDTKKEAQAVVLNSDATNYSYSKDIKPIFEAHCNSCHGYGSYYGNGGYLFNKLEDVHKAVKNGKLMGSIKWQNGYKPMPKGYGKYKLDDADITKIESWIAKGMKD